ncbi:hypothetical protein BME99_15870 [Pseudomonas protegens]|nr:hypothetical protein BME99_15870 [Pseudomonas protegens]
MGAALLVSLGRCCPWIVVGISIQTGWATIAELVLRPRVAQLLGNTLCCWCLTCRCACWLGCRWPG